MIFWGFTASAQTLEEQFNEIASRNEMAGGSLAVFCEKGVIETLSIGKSDLNRHIKTTTDTKYRLASVSKIITAIAIMQLAEKNHLDLDADISKILGFKVENPAYPAIAITTRMLLSHTSTITDDSSYDNFLKATITNHPIPDLRERLTPSGTYYSSGQFLQHKPGGYFTYANINYVILGTIIEKVSGIRFDIYCKKYIVNPLGIEASFNVLDLTNMDQLAVIYRKIDGEWIPQTDNFEGKRPALTNLIDYIPGTNGGRFGPQGGFRCSAKDMAKLFQVLVNHGKCGNKTLLSPASCNDMTGNQWTFSGDNGDYYSGLFRSWGLGIHRITSTPYNDIVLPGSSSMIGHSGDAYGLVSDVYYDKKRKIGFVFITNGVGTGYQSKKTSSFYAIEQEIFDAIEKYGKINRCLQAEKHLKKTKK